MCDKKFTDRRYLKKNVLSQFWLNDLMKFLSLMNRCYKTLLIQTVFNDDIVWSNHFGEKKSLSKDQKWSITKSPTFKQVFVSKMAC